MATCTVSGTVLDPSGTAVSGAPVSFNTQTPTLSADPVEGSTSTASDGTWSLALQQGLSGIFSVGISPSPIGRPVLYKFNVNIPSSLTASFSSIVVDN